MMNVQERLVAIRGLNPAPVADRKSFDIRDLKKGGYVDWDSQTWLVKNVYLYLDVKWKDFSKRKKDYWVTELELYSLNNGQIRFVEWEFDDELEVSQTDSIVALRDIQYDGRSIKHRDLEEISEEEEGEVIVDGTKYFYVEDDTWAGLFIKSGGSKEGIPMRAYEFASQQATYLTIETWHEEDDERPEREAFLSHEVKANVFEVLQTSVVN
ncbi:MAG: DUF4178 domain-containing protein [Woeseiaceae bacterium]